MGLRAAYALTRGILVLCLVSAGAARAARADGTRGTAPGEIATPEQTDAWLPEPDVDATSPAGTEPTADVAAPEVTIPEATAPAPAAPEVAAAAPAVVADPATPPDRESLRRLVATDPSRLGTLSIGTPSGGLLFNPRPMPEGPLWTIRNPGSAFATDETIGFLVTALQAVEARFPGSPRVLLGDMSQATGGRLSRHRSHQAGRDVDIGLYYRTGEQKDFRRPLRNELDVARTWALIRALATQTDVERIFIDRSIQKVLLAHALALGEDRAWLDDLFGWAGGREPLVQHEPLHVDHMHVRFYNPRAQEWGRRAYPLLAEAGLVPPPLVTHVVRSGETLGGLARRYGVSVPAIRAANGLRTNALRAGRPYAIPLRRVPDVDEAVVIPPRRLPPDDLAIAHAGSAGRGAPGQ